MKNEKDLFFIDAETDGLYGKFISVAIIVTNSKCEELERFYYGIEKEKLTVDDEWTKENVLPILGEYDECKDEKELLEKVWEAWNKYRENAYAVADVCFPVEARLFARCVESEKERKFKGPFPLLDLSSVLFANGVEPLSNREKLADNRGTKKRHNALDDVEMTIDIYRKYMI